MFTPNLLGIIECIKEINCEVCRVFYPPFINELKGSEVAECLTRDRGAAGLSLTCVTDLSSLSKTHLS